MSLWVVVPAPQVQVDLSALAPVTEMAWAATVGVFAFQPEQPLLATLVACAYLSVLLVV
jgi:hypothetical protein